MTLQNHLLTNTIQLPHHQHILFPVAKKIMSRNQTHFPQNPSHANHSHLSQNTCAISVYNNMEPHIDQTTLGLITIKAEQ